MVAAVVGAATVATNLFTASNQADAAQQASQVQIDNSGRALDIQQADTAWARADLEKQRALQLADTKEQRALQQSDTAAVRALQTQAMNDQRTARDNTTKLLSPWVTAGNTALTGQQDILGMNGNPAQDFALSQIRNSPAFTGMKKEGENAILQNASATGGLRGGNVQGALAQFDESLLGRLIDQQYGRLTGVAGTGENAAAGIGTAGTNTADALARGANSYALTPFTATPYASNAGTSSAGAQGSIYGDIGAASAGGILGAARANATAIGGLANGAGVIAGRFGSTPTFNANSSYNSSGTFSPYYTGGTVADPAYG